MDYLTAQGEKVGHQGAPVPPPPFVTEQFGRSARHLQECGGA